MSISGATRFANVLWKFFKNVNNPTQTLCQILRMVTIEIAINSTLGAQHFALHPAGIAFAFEVMLLVSS